MAHNSSMRSQRWAHALLEHAGPILLRWGHYTTKKSAEFVRDDPWFLNQISFYEDGRPGVRLGALRLSSTVECDNVLAIARISLPLHAVRRIHVVIDVRI